MSCNTEDTIYKIRHTLAHVLAKSVLAIDPGAKIAIGPPIDDGFYYDFQFSEGVTFGDTQLKDLQKSMRKTIQKGFTPEMREVSPEEARELFKDQPYKLELIEEFAAEKSPITVYEIDDFVDLCEGPHVSDANEINVKSFKMSRVAGAYWRGDEHNPMLTRIYGYAFETPEQLAEHLAMLEEAKKRDHRKIAKELDLFFISDEVGKGLPLWSPKGAFVRKKLEDYMYAKEQEYGYDYVYTPILTKESLYEKSGHLAHYKDDMYSPMDIEGENYYLRPMNCPHHHMIFNRKPVSYKELPIKLAEFGLVHRFELSGVLTGIIRTRGFTQNDSHIYTNKEQLKHEILDVLSLFDKVYEDLNISDYWYRLSLPDHSNKEKYGDIDNKEMWNDSAQLTREALQEYGAKFVEEEGEAAFYGPKIDVQVRNVLGKEDTIATIQIDFYSANKFNINYINNHGEKEPVVIIHRAIMGSFERFIGFLIEETAGAFPTWLSPEQVHIAPIADTHLARAKEIKKTLTAAGIRAKLPDPTDSLGKRIRNAKKGKVPYIVVIGDKECDENVLTVEVRGEAQEEHWQDKLENISPEDFLKRLKKEVERF